MMNHKLMAELVSKSYNENNIISINKFAELVVRECISIIEPTDHHKAYPYSYLGELEGLDLIEEQVFHIKKHFGIE